MQDTNKMCTLGQQPLIISPDEQFINTIAECVNIRPHAMNNNPNSSVYKRRAALMNRSCSGYLNMAMHFSRESLDDVSEDANFDARSIHSTCSSRSFRTWKKAQRKRWKFKNNRAQSVCGDAADHIASTKTTFDPFTFNTRSQNFFRSSQRSTEKGKVEFEQSSQSSLVDMEAERDCIESTQDNNEACSDLSTIMHSPVEPYYSSSDLEISSDEGESTRNFDITCTQESLRCDEYENTRDWLMSGSFEHDNNEDTTKTKEPILHRVVVTKTSKFSSSDMKRNIIESRGLNDLSSIVSPVKMTTPSIHDIKACDEQMRDPLTQEQEIALEANKPEKVASSTPCSIRRPCFCESSTINDILLIPDNLVQTTPSEPLLVSNSSIELDRKLDFKVVNVTSIKEIDDISLKSSNTLSNNSKLFSSTDISDYQRNLEESKTDKTTDPTEKQDTDVDNSKESLPTSTSAKQVCESKEDKFIEAQISPTTGKKDFARDQSASKSILNPFVVRSKLQVNPVDKTQICCCCSVM